MATTTHHSSTTHSPSHHYYCYRFPRPLRYHGYTSNH
uniref:Uncharacterized protein n=1 Tax=Siphoviridae sp. ctHip2 TaxID=2827830 RepID=A0A8S5RVC4_9CAUD|nr:MAG TPA: hypothetical protein [Siphoviridae sp. ctHip2]